MSRSIATFSSVLVPKSTKNEGFGHSLIKPCSFFAFVFPSFCPYLHCLTFNYRFSDIASSLFHSLTFNYCPLLSPLYSHLPAFIPLHLIIDLFRLFTAGKVSHEKVKLWETFPLPVGNGDNDPKKKRLGKKNRKSGKLENPPTNFRKTGGFFGFFSKLFF